MTKFTLNIKNISLYLDWDFRDTLWGRRVMLYLGC